MDWTTIADNFTMFMQSVATVFLIYGLVLAITSVLPERLVRRFTFDGRRRPAPKAPAAPVGEAVPTP